ncbi:MAG TPA: DEAD/DEAH box helicase, partial [Isosphaeraceae bacterium]|nr:DEAD/DEAH box helicase [Isosphaeraceae bacterium]
MRTKDDAPHLDPLGGPVRTWFAAAFPAGPTPAQRLAWPAIAGGEHTLLVSPTGTGKTLAAFLAILDGLYRQHAAGTLARGLRCVYVSPLRSLGYDIERNLGEPIEGIRKLLGVDASPVRIGVRTGDTSAYQRAKLRDDPPHLLITTPESLSLMLSQSAWAPAWKGVTHLVVDEVHALVPNKRGADLAVSLERLAAMAAADPVRVGLSATCRPPEPVARFLVGPGRSCRILEAPSSSTAPEIDVESLIRGDEAPHRGLTYRRLLRRLDRAMGKNRTTIVFANTRAFAEKLTHDLRAQRDPHTIAAHHSALDAERRRDVESKLKAGELRAVVTSTSLELGVDIGEADLSVLVGLPGSASRCLQRVGRAGHRPGATTRGLLLAASPAELMGAAVTARAAIDGRIEPLRMVENPLDVLCQQLIGMACAGEWSADEAFALIRRAGPMATLSRHDFDACLDFLAGELAAPSGAYEP